MDLASIWLAVALLAGLVVGFVAARHFGKNDMGLDTLKRDREALQQQLDRERAARGDAEKSLMESRTRLEESQKNAAEKLQVLESARETLVVQFKAMAGEIMDANAKRFAEQSQSNLGTILDPLKERIVEFQKKVDDIYVSDTKDRTALKEQVQQLLVLNRTLSDDAQQLTSALRGSSKAQGNWGELILKRLLEDAGLQEGREFELQDSHTNEQGKRQQPDCVIRLPEQRALVVDSKVSLVAFERLTAAETPEDRSVALREHLQSLRAHIKGLDERRYERLYDTTIDFVVMFVPIEPAFMMAVTSDDRLFADAWDKNVLLVSPSTLMFVLRSVAYLWRQEAQSKNARDIAERGQALYDKLVGFVSDLEAVGGKLDSAQASYATALRKLHTGPGNVIRQAEMLRELGIKSNKTLPKSLVDAALEAGVEAAGDDATDGTVALPPAL
ncbi:MAG TPA: DNA recombination protein RmuC [Gemmatimonas sp.]|uniref:DNA recombination protein RmuC n=1 Tax=Gemmatimonas sp. TaxID=1962908 RepID=UPI002ED9EF24